MVPHQQLSLHRLLGTDLAHLGRSKAEAGEGFSELHTDQIHALTSERFSQHPQVPCSPLRQCGPVSEQQCCGPSTEHFHSAF